MITTNTTNQCFKSIKSQFGNASRYISSSMSCRSNQLSNYLLSNYLDTWVNEASADEHEVRLRVKNRIQIINGQLMVQGNLDLSNTNISSLPQGLHVECDLNLKYCSSLISLPKGLKVGSSLFLDHCINLREFRQGVQLRGYLSLMGCTSLTSLPQGIYVRCDLDLRNCTSLTSLPQGLLVDQNILLRGCDRLREVPPVIRGGGPGPILSTDDYVGFDLRGWTSLTELPNWVFELGTVQRVNAENTGIPPRLLEEYNNRQNADGYTGPRIEFSINDYRSTSDVRASELPNLVQTITKTKADHPFWQFSATQTETRSLFNSFAVFLTRLLNELPSGNNRQRDLDQLRQKLTPLFRKMEAEYDLKNQDIRRCDLINNHILSTAETAVGTCIDKVKVGYLFMQLFLKDDFKVDLNTISTIIKTVEDIASAQVIFDPSTNQFIHVAKTILNGKFSDELKLQAKYLLKQTDDSSIELTADEMDQLESGLFTLDRETLAQTLAQAIIHLKPQIRAIRIGDQVEDILNLAYKILNDDFHKIDMRFAGCCTLKNASDIGRPQYETAAITYIQQILHEQQTQHNSAITSQNKAAIIIQKQVRDFLVRHNNQDNPNCINQCFQIWPHLFEAWRL